MKYLGNLYKNKRENFSLLVDRYIIDLEKAEGLRYMFSQEDIDALKRVNNVQLFTRNIEAVDHFNDVSKNDVIKMIVMFDRDLLVAIKDNCNNVVEYGVATWTFLQDWVYIPILSDYRNEPDIIPMNEMYKMDVIAPLNSDTIIFEEI